ncbi:MAG: extracellular solute-binding protein [Chloroflexota bacterium]
MRQQTLSRRRFLQFTAGAAGLAALSACAAPAPSGGGSSSGGDAPAVEVTTISLGLTWDATFQKHQGTFNDNFMEAHPEIELDTQYNTWADHNNIVPTWAAADTLPDIIYVHGSRAFPWAFEGISISIQDFVDSDEEFNVAGVWEESLRLYRFQGEQHGIPYDHGPMLIGYNKDIFDAAGMDYPDETWDMNKFREVANELTNLDGDQPQWGYTAENPAFGGTSGPSTLGGWGAQLLNDDENQLLLDTDEAREAVQFWVDMIHVDKCAPTPAESEAFEQGPWLSGQIAMANVPSWETPSLTQFASFGWDVAPWPTGPVARVTGSFGSGFSITNDSTEVDASWAFMREYLSEEGMSFVWGSSGRGSPAREASYASWMDSENAPEHANYYLEALSDYAVTARPYQTLAAAELNDIISRQVTLLKNGDTDATSAIAAIVQEGQPVLDEGWERLQAG